MKNLFYICFFFAAGTLCAQSSLRDTAWSLEFINQNGEFQPVTAQNPPLLTFAADGSLFGFSGVNRISGTWKSEGTALTLSNPLAMTRRMAISDELNKLESDFTQRLSAVRAWQLSAGSGGSQTLLLLNAEGLAVLRFTRAKSE